MIAEIRTTLDPLLANPWWRVGLILGCGVLLMILFRLVVLPILRRLVNRTSSTFDDAILDKVRPPILQTIFLEAVRFALIDVIKVDRYDYLVSSIIHTGLILIWGRAVLKVTDDVFMRLSRVAGRYNWIQPRTLPLIRFITKVILFSVQAYLVLSAWDVSLTSWLASAGVIGIAVGFAAKDTLANLFSGVFILVDAPYTVGQYIIIDDVTRGMVTDIGMRSTRLLTRDNVEVTVPNAVIGNAKIINESSGPSPRMRVRVSASVAYGSDVDRVKQILHACSRDVPHTCDEDKVAVRFVLMGESSLDFQVMVWLAEPMYRGRVIDILNTRIYKALGEAGIEIPFPQRDLHIKEWPGGQQVEVED